MKKGIKKRDESVRTETDLNGRPLPKWRTCEWVIQPRGVENLCAPKSCSAGAGVGGNRRGGHGKVVKSWWHTLFSVRMYIYICTYMHLYIYINYKTYIYMILWYKDIFFLYRETYKIMDVVFYNVLFTCISTFLYTSFFKVTWIDSPNRGHIFCPEEPRYYDVLWRNISFSIRNGS